MKPWAALPLAGWQGGYTLVDKADLPLVAHLRWGRCGRSIRAFVLGANGRPTTIAIHRVIMGAKPGQLVDHVNGDILDNRRENLRFATHAQNAANVRRAQFVAKTGYKGVSQTAPGRWRASCKHGAQRRVGYATAEAEAARLYDDYARELFGDFARLNFPREGERAANVGEKYVARAA